MVLPCPGDMACMAPRPRAARAHNSIQRQPSCFSWSIRERKSPRTTVPGAVGCCERKDDAAATGATCVAATSEATCAAATEAACELAAEDVVVANFGDQSTEAVKSWGGVMDGSLG